MLVDYVVVFHAFKAVLDQFLELEDMDRNFVDLSFQFGVFKINRMTLRAE